MVILNCEILFPEIIHILVKIQSLDQSFRCGRFKKKKKKINICFATIRLCFAKKPYKDHALI